MDNGAAPRTLYLTARFAGARVCQRWPVYWPQVPQLTKRLAKRARNYRDNNNYAGTVHPLRLNLAESASIWRILCVWILQPTHPTCG